MRDMGITLSWYAHSESAYRPSYQSGRHQISNWHEGAWNAWTPNHDHEGHRVADPYGVAFASATRNGNSDSAKAHDRISHIMTGDSNLWSITHNTRNRTLNQLAEDSRGFKRIISVGNTMTNVNTGVATAATGVGTAASWVAAAPIHAALGPFAALSVPLHALATIVAPAAVAGTAAGGATRLLHLRSMDQARDVVKDRAHEIGRNGRAAADDRRGSYGGRLRNHFGEGGLDHLNTIFRDVDENAQNLAAKLGDVYRRNTVDDSYAAAGIPTVSAEAFYSRAEEIRIGMNA